MAAGKSGKQGETTLALLYNADAQGPTLCLHVMKITRQEEFKTAGGGGLVNTPALQMGLNRNSNIAAISIKCISCLITL